MKKTYTPERIKYLNKKIVESNRKRILEERKRSWARLIFCNAALYSIVGLCGIVGTNIMGISAFIALCIEVGCLSYIENEKYTIQANKFVKENNHLHTIKYSLKKDENSNKERTNKLIKLYSDRKQVERKLDDAETLNWLSYLVTTIGVMSAFINPTTMWLPIVGIVGNVLAGVNKLQKVRNKEEIISQTINIENELDLIRFIESNREKKEEVESKNKNHISKRRNKRINGAFVEFADGSYTGFAFLDDEEEKSKVYYKSREDR